MRSSFLLTVAAFLGATLSAAMPTPAPQEATSSVTEADHTLTYINIDSDFITKLELMFKGEYVPPGYEHLIPAKRGDLFPGSGSAETTRNELNEGKCGPAILIYARGTTQSGNIGDKPGIKFAKDFVSAIPGSIVQGVLPYPADVFGYLAGGSAEGAQAMASLTAKAASQCPGSKIILSGYSQGAQVVHKAAALISSSLYSRVAAIVLYGDPKRGDRFPGTLNNNVLTICNDGDLICEGLPLPFGSHQGDHYEPTVAKAVAYIKARV